MGRTARLVLGIPLYAALGVLTAAATLTLFVVSQNPTLVADVVVGGSLPVSARLTVVVELYPFVGTSYTTPAGVLLLLVAALTGVDVAMVVYHLREHGVTVREGSGSLLGVVLGTLGAGCAACGSAVVAGLFALVGAGGALTLLPFEGLEFAAVAVVALLLSIHWLASGMRMRGEEVNGCPVEV